MSPARLLIVDDHRMFLDGVVSILAGEPDLTVALATATAAEALRWLDAGHAADLVITDVNMDEMDGVTLNARLKRDYPAVKTLALSMRGDAATVHALIEGGVDGYVPKDAESTELLRGIRAVLRGERYFTPSIQRGYMASMFGPRPATAVELTRREREVLRLIAAERTTQEIADELFLSKHTVEGYRKSLISKLGVRNLAGLVKEAVRRGMA